MTLAALLVVPVALAAPPPAPAGVVVATVDGQALVSWTPAPGAEAYRVYGVSDGALAFLAEVPASVEEPVARVAGGFASYGVTAVRGAEESPPTYGPGEPCISIETSPPAVLVSVASCLHEVASTLPPPR